MTNQDSTHQEYLNILVQYFEEEIMGEAYFAGLADHFRHRHEREKLALMARVERTAAEAVRPLLLKYELTPRPDQALWTIGESWIERHADTEWDALMVDIAERYPDYLVQFHALEDMAPEEDRAFINTMTEHEVVAIEFAKMEIARDPESTTSLETYVSAESGSAAPKE